MTKRKSTSCSCRQPGTPLSASLRTIASPDFNRITLINFLAMSTYYMLFVTGTAYAREAYDLSLSVAALSTGLMVLGCLAGRFAGGNIISSIGLKPMLCTGLLCYCGCLGAFYYMSNIAMLCIQRSLLGFCLGMVVTATGTYVACIVPHEHHGLGISIFSISTVLALAFGPFLGILLTDFLSYGQIVGISLLTGIGCVCLAYSVGRAQSLYRTHRPFFKLNSYIDPRLVHFSFIAMLVSLSYGSVQIFLPSYAAHQGFTTSASLFFVCYALGALLTRPVTGRLFDRFGERLLLPPFFIITMLALLILAFTNSSGALLGAAFLLGIGIGNYQSIGQAVVISRVTRSRYAQATSTFFIFFDLGIGIGPYLLGMIVPLAGYAGMFTALALITFAALILYWLITD